MASSQLILDKTCLNDYGFAPDICDDLQHHDANNTVVQVFHLKSPFFHLLSTSECCGPIRCLREHSRPSFPHCCFFLLWVMERYIWTQVAPLSLLPHQVYPFACGSSIRLNGAYGSCFILQTCGGLIHAPQRPLHVVAQRVPPLLRQSACRTIWRLHHIQVEHPSYLLFLQNTP